MNDKQTTAAIQAAARIGEIAALADQTFIARHEATRLLAATIGCGEHLIFLGKPGTGKSALLRFFARQMDVVFFRKQLNPDVKRENLIGPINPKVLAESGLYRRNLAGLATCDVAFMDEVGKGSDQVVWMILDAMEERMVDDGTEDAPIPLHTVVGASNETLSRASAAVWDRFSSRMVLVGPRKTSDWQDAVVANVEITDKNPVTREELRLIRQLARDMALNPNKRVMDTLTTLRSEYAARMVPPNQDSPIEIRRWQKVLRMAAGSALALRGDSEIRPHDLWVAKHMLWDRLEEQEKVFDLVDETIEQGSQKFAETKALVEEIKAQIEREGDAMVFDEQAKAHYRLTSVVRTCQDWAEVEPSEDWDIVAEEARRLQDLLTDTI